MTDCGISVFISSKQGELDTERAIVREEVRRAGLRAVLAEEWPPARTGVPRNYLDRVRECAVYVGLFDRILSVPTLEEYKCAVGNPYREVLIYIRDRPSEERAVELSNALREMRKQHTCFDYDKVESLLSVVRKHLRAALTRMVNVLISLGTASEPGLAWGRLPNHSGQQGPMQAFLACVGFPGGRYAAEQAETVIAQMRSVIAMLE